LALNIALIIVNYNGSKFLPRFLPKIAECCKESGISLIITDDLSKDDSIQFLTEGGYLFTENKIGKHGFAANVNNGIRFALSNNLVDYFIIANNDIEIANELLPLIKTVVKELAKNDAKLGLIGVKEMFAEEQAAFSSYEYATYQQTQIQKTTSLPGCFFLVSKKLVDTIGFMDEEYFMYGEDNDYFVRTLKAGFGIYNTNLPVMHYSEGSSTSSQLTSWYVYRNAFLFAQKNLGIVGCLRMFISFLNQIYNPFYQPHNPGNLRVTRNGVLYNSYLLLKSIAWNLQYFFKKHFFSK
jgi:GT2 family glycosyltransferase